MAKKLYEIIKEDLDERGSRSLQDLELMLSEARCEADDGRKYGQILDKMQTELKRLQKREFNDPFETKEESE